MEVTPLAGVWIEITTQVFADYIVSVTPLAGVWIEMSISTSVTVSVPCHSPCGSVD